VVTLYIDRQKVRLRKKDKRFIVEEEGKVAVDIPSFRINQIIAFGGVELTIPALSLLFQENIDMVFLSKKGKFKGRIYTPGLSLVTLRLKQYNRRNDMNFTLALARAFVKGKLTNLRTFLMRFNRSGDKDLACSILHIRNALKSLDRADNLDVLRGYEGAGTGAYFSAFPKVLKYDLGFRKRVKRPPTDPVNALLSFGYMLLVNDINTVVNIVGLDPYIGFLHEPQDRKTTLVFDLMEEFRPVIVDSVVVSVINRRYLTFSDFEKNSETGGINISKTAIGRFINYYHERLSTVVYHKVSGQHVTYKKCLELQARMAARYIKGEISEYIPLTPR